MVRSDTCRRQHGNLDEARQPSVAMAVVGTLAPLGRVMQLPAAATERLCVLCTVPSWIGRTIDKALTQAFNCKWFLIATNDRT